MGLGYRFGGFHEEDYGALESRLGPPLYGNYLLGLGCISSSGFAGEGGGG